MKEREIDKDFISPKDVATLMGIGLSRVYELLRSDGFPAIPLSESHYQVPRTAFMAWYTNPDRIIEYKRNQITLQQRTAEGEESNG